MEIPRYPSFRHIAKHDQEVFEEALRRSPPEISEFTFTNLYSWRTAYEINVSRHEDFIIVRAGHERQRRFYDPIGTGDRKAVIESILSQEKTSFIRLPESTASLFTGDARYAVSADRDNADYLFKVSDLVNLAGSRYDGKRNLIKKFKSLFQYEYVPLDHSHRDECLGFEEEWCRLKECARIEGLQLESIAVKEMIHNCETFSLIGGGIRVNGAIVAIAMGQELNPATLVMHVLKAVPSMPGLYQTINREFLAHEATSHPFVNFEQDLGSEGLRKAKLSYHPVRIISKYTLTMR